MVRRRDPARCAVVIPSAVLLASGPLCCCDPARVLPRSRSVRRRYSSPPRHWVGTSMAAGS